jgi:hypothetical protein
MALSDDEVAIMRSLRTSGGRSVSMPKMLGRTEDDMMTAIDRLQERQFVRVIGPPNANSKIGQDVDELQLQPFGSNYLRFLR